MQQNFQDAMAIVRKYGKPDLFITMTCNPNWREIRNALRKNQCTNDRPDLSTRVFKQKLDRLLRVIHTEGIFGVTIAHVFVVEFQKRGLPGAAEAQNAASLRQQRMSGRCQSQFGRRHKKQGA